MSVVYSWVCFISQDNHNFRNQGSLPLELEVGWLISCEKKLVECLAHHPWQYKLCMKQVKVKNVHWSAQKPDDETLYEISHEHPAIIQV